VVANGGAQAIDFIRKKRADIDLVILDLIMPGMDGGAVFERIRDIMPAMPVILSSGDAISGQVTRMMQKGGNGFIQKPFIFYALSEKIRKKRNAVKNASQDGCSRFVKAITGP
jgi:CheY-like chemotaxis protein